MPVIAGLLYIFTGAFYYMSIRTNSDAMYLVYALVAADIGVTAIVLFALNPFPLAT
jgi:hypothetical protein